MPATENNILDQKISDLAVSGPFKDFTTQNNLETLKDLVAVRICDLKKMKGFTYHILEEIIQVMKNNELVYLINEN